MESSLKSFIDRFRAKPEWQSPDPAVRAAAVLRLSAEERELLPGFAEDPDPRVRKAAVKKIHDIGLLVRLATTDPDPGVREEAADTLAGMAIHAQDPAAGRAALEGLSQPRQLLTVVRTAADPAMRRAALDLITDAKTLAAAGREAIDGDLRLLAVSRLGDPGQLLSLALNSEHKPVALAAADKLQDEAALRAVSERAKSPAAARRARSRLESSGFSTASTEPPGAPAPAAAPGGDDVAEREAYEQKLEALRQEQEAKARALAEREAVCEKLEGAAAELARDVMDEARGAWEGLSPLQGSEAEALQSRFEAALDACHRRHESWTASQEVRAQLEALLPEAEALAEGPDLAAARTGFLALQKKWQEMGGDAQGLSDLGERFGASARRLGEREAEARKEREAAERKNLARLTALAGRLETLARTEAPTLRDVDRAMRDAKEALEHPGSLPSKKDRDTLHSRLEAARRALYPRLQELRADTEWKRWANESVQEELVGRAEALRSETNLDKAAQALRDLDARWKAAAEVDKEKGETLWKHFKAARDEVKAKVDAYFERRAAEFAETPKKKEELCVRAEALQESTDWLRTAEALQKLQAEWKDIGPSAHGPGKAVWERFRKACDHFFSAPRGRPQAAQGGVGTERGEEGRPHRAGGGPRGLPGLGRCGRLGSRRSRPNGRPWARSRRATPRRSGSASGAPATSSSSATSAAIRSPSKRARRNGRPCWPPWRSLSPAAQASAEAPEGLAARGRRDPGLVAPGRTALAGDGRDGRPVSLGAAGRRHRLPRRFQGHGPRSREREEEAHEAVRASRGPRPRGGFVHEEPGRAAQGRPRHEHHGRTRRGRGQAPGRGRGGARCTRGLCAAASRPRARRRGPPRALRGGGAPGERPASLKCALRLRRSAFGPPREPRKRLPALPPRSEARRAAPRAERARPLREERPGCGGVRGRLAPA